MDSGETDEARRLLAGARRALEEADRAEREAGGGATLASALIWVELLIAVVRLALRRGTVRDAETYAAEAAQRLRPLDPVDACDRTCELAHLRANIALGRGAYRLALRYLEDGLAVAREHGSEWVVDLHRSLGALSTRRGRPADGAYHYRMALDRLPAAGDDPRAATLHANLAMANLMQGRVADAAREARRALRVRDRPGAPPGPLANTLALMALIAQQDPELVGPAAPYWDRALEQAERAADVALLAEIELRAAAGALERGEPKLAARWLASGRARAAAVARQEPTIAALADDVEGALCWSAGDRDGARQAWQRARRAFAEVGAAYHVARLDAALASVYRQGGDARWSVLWDQACRAARRGGFVLPAQFGPGRPPRAEGVRVDRRAGVLEAFGVRYALGRGAIPVRLCALLISASPKAIGAPALCRRLWRDEGYTPATFNRLKVHVHRLRQLIGHEQAPILTEGRPGRLAYRWNPAVEAPDST